MDPRTGLPLTVYPPYLDQSCLPPSVVPEAADMGMDPGYHFASTYPGVYGDPRVNRHAGRFPPWENRYPGNGFPVNPLNDYPYAPGFTPPPLPVSSTDTYPGFLCPSLLQLASSQQQCYRPAVSFHSPWEINPIRGFSPANQNYRNHGRTDRRQMTASVSDSRRPHFGNNEDLGLLGFPGHPSSLSRTYSDLQSYPEMTGYPGCLPSCSSLNIPLDLPYKPPTATVISPLESSAFGEERGQGAFLTGVRGSSSSYNPPELARSFQCSPDGPSWDTGKKTTSTPAHHGSRMARTEVPVPSPFAHGNTASPGNWALLPSQGRDAEGEKHQCPICAQESPDVSSLFSHMPLHQRLEPPQTVEKGYFCNVCNRWFPLRSQQENHMRIHEVSFPYQCSLCYHRFNTNQDLHNHNKSHEEEFARKLSV